MQRNKLSEAIEALKNGRIVVYPTDTLYAFGVDIYNEGAVRKVFETKKRPFDNPLSIAVPNFFCIEKIAIVNDNAKRLAKHFLPGSLTLILDKKNTVLDIITSDLSKIAIRIPNNTVALDLLTKFGPLTATSANVHGMETPGTIKDIRMQFKDDNVAVYLDYGTLQGRPSTIVDVTYEEPKIIREGTITKKEISAVI